MVTHFTSRKLTHARKVANPVGGDADKSFEQSFASLSYSYLQEKAPALLDYLIGFQLVDRNPDETRAAGVFGFNANGQVIFVPMFFLNKDLKGHEMMYLQEQDIFVPLKENWVNFVLSTSGLDLGDSETQSLGELKPDNPDLKSLTRIPGMGKASHYHMEPELADWVRPFMPIMANLMVANSYRLQKYAGLDDRLAARQELMADPSVLASCHHWYNHYPAFRRSFDKNASVLEFKTAADTIRAKLAQSQDLLEQPVRYPKTATPNLKSVSIRIYTERSFAQSDDDLLPELSDKDKEQLRREGFVIQDDRSADDKSIAYEISLPQHYRNPVESGFYDVMFKPFEARSCYISTTVYGEHGTVSGLCLIYDLSSKTAFTATIQDVWTWQSSDQHLSKEETQKKLKDLPSASTLKQHKVYTILAPSGDALDKFHVNSRIGKDYYDIGFRDWHDESHRDWAAEIPLHAGRGIRAGSSTLRTNVDNYVVVRTPDAYYVPKDSIIIDCSGGDDDYGMPMSCCNSPDKNELRLANMTDMQFYLRSKMAEVKLVDLVDEVLVNDTAMSKQAALFHLIRDVGLAETQARTILTDLATKQASRYYIKQAGPGDVERSYAGEGPGASVQFASGDTNINQDTYLEHQERTSESLAEVIDSLQASLTDPEIYNPMTNITPHTELDWPSGSGDGQDVPQDDVFDTLFIGNMLQASRKDNLVKQYLPDLLKAGDRLARLLINMWWHPDEFEKWYGKSEIKDLEDGLLNVFEGLGDINLKLQQKEINPLGETADIASPDVDAVANN